MRVGERFYLPETRDEVPIYTVKTISIKTLSTPTEIVDYPTMKGRRS